MKYIIYSFLALAIMLSGYQPAAATSSPACNYDTYIRIECYSLSIWTDSPYTNRTYNPVYTPYAPGYYSGFNTPLLNPYTPLYSPYSAGYPYSSSMTSGYNPLMTPPYANYNYGNYSFGQHQTFSNFGGYYPSYPNTIMSCQCRPLYYFAN